jgi:hypothetical protein
MEHHWGLAATEAVATDTYPSFAPALQPLLDMQLAATAADKQQQQQQQQLFTQADLSKGLLAAVSLLPEWYEDTPKAPVLVAECIGHFMAAGQVSFGLDQLVSAVTAAGVQKATGEEREEEEEAPLIEEEKAAPMVLTVLDLIKVGEGGHSDWGSGCLLRRGWGDTHQPLRQNASAIAVSGPANMLADGTWLPSTAQGRNS